MQNFRLLTAQVKFHQIFTLKVYKVSAKKSVEELCLMTPKSQIVHTPFLQGGWASNQTFEKDGEGLTTTQLLEEGCWEREGRLFSGAVVIFT